MSREGDKAVDTGLQRILYWGVILGNETQRGLVWRKQRKK